MNLSRIDYKWIVLTVISLGIFVVALDEGAVRIILRDLYEWHEPITSDNWRRLDAVVRQRADDRTWHHGILDRLHIRRSATELARREQGEDDERLQYALEWGFFTRCQWGEFDTALYELERCWGRAEEL